LSQSIAGIIIQERKKHKSSVHAHSQHDIYHAQ